MSTDLKKKLKKQLQYYESIDLRPPLMIQLEARNKMLSQKFKGGEQ